MTEEPPKRKLAFREPVIDAATLRRLGLDRAARRRLEKEYDRLAASATRLMLQDLARSAIDRERSLDLGFCPIEGDTEPRYRIPYYKDGRFTGFWRDRLLGEGKFAPKQRYDQPANSIPQLYMPTIYDWAAIRSDPRIALRITEGEKKAAAGCLNNLITAGLGGIWNKGSKKARQVLIPDLKDFEWKNRLVEIIFDSDVAGRADLLGALYDIGWKLTTLGARAVHIDLPPSMDLPKVGYDDFLIASGPEAFLKLPRITFDTADALAKINIDYAYIESPAGRVLRYASDRQASYEILTRKDFETDTDNRAISTIGTDGGERKFYPGHEWFSWSGQARVSGLVYTPRRFGEPLQIGDGSFNIWPGWAYEEPKKGNVKLWSDLLDHLCSQEPAPAVARKYLEQWLAYPIQNPGAKLYSALVLQGVQGGGKTLLGYTLRQCVYGFANVSEIGPSDLHSQFNDWLARRQLILAEEVVSSDKRADINRLKGPITSETVRVNVKHVAQYHLTNRANFIFTSNDPVPLSMTGDDRRAFVLGIDTKLKEAWGVAKVAAYDKWHKSDAGAAALSWHLLNEVDLAGFNPKAEPPMTQAKLEVIDNSKSALENFIRLCVESYDQVFTLAGEPTPCDFQTATALARRYDPDGKQGPKLSVTIGRTLAQAQFANRVVKFTGVNTREGKQRLYAFRNLKEWQKVKKAKNWKLATEHYDGAWTEAEKQKDNKEQEIKFWK